MDDKKNNLPDEKNPMFLFNTIDTDLLAAAVRGEIDLLNLAKIELANRGVDASGTWVGFANAKKAMGV